MHTQILGLIEGTRIDHARPENTLDNRRSNLRRATASENGANRGIPAHNKSGFKGVSWHKARSKWRAFIKVNRKQIHLGLFSQKEDAARVYDQAAILHFGKFARLNFSRRVP
jgi:hypothetical protein